MEDIPELALLELFRWLGTKQLLLVRAVCRRWRELALEPALWRHRKWSVVIPSGPKQRLLSQAVLRLAPCLHTLRCTTMGRDTSSPASAALLDCLAEARCGAQELLLKLSRLPSIVGSHCFASISRAVQHQVALGRLAKLELTFMVKRDSAYDITFHSKQQEEDVNGLTQLLMALATSGVPELQVGNLDGFSENLLSYSVKAAVNACSGAAAVPASMKRLSVHPHYALTGLSAFLVRGHAASLVEITLPPYFRVSLSSFPALPNLRKLKSLIPLDMTVLLGSPQLESLHIFLNEEVEKNPSCLDRGAWFFRKATQQLQSLAFEFQVLGACAVARPALLDMVSAACFSSCFALESLSLNTGFGDYTEDDALLRVMASALPGLLHLRTLEFGWGSFSKELLSRLLATAGAHPRLEKVSLLSQRGEDFCSHAFCHGDDVRSAMGRNPRLHLLLRLGWCGAFVRRNAACVACTAGCHPELKKERVVGVYSHAASQPCSLHKSQGPEFRVVPWVRPGEALA